MFAIGLCSLNAKIRIERVEKEEGEGREVVSQEGKKDLG